MDIQNNCTAQTERPLEPPPIMNDFAKEFMYTIVIRNLNGNGFTVEVGCKSFAFETKTAMLDKIIQYVNQPAETEMLFNQGLLFVP